MELLEPIKLRQTRRIIIALSIVIPLAVAVLFKVKISGFDLSFLPAIYAGINAITAVFLISALIAIKKQKRELHRALIRIALLLSILFLLLYVVYHMTSDSTLYGDTDGNGALDILEREKIGAMAYFYYSLLISHIILSVVVIPLVLFSYLFAWQGDFERHKRWTRFSFPIWLFVAVSGVIVYYLISPYYT